MKSTHFKCDSSVQTIRVTQREVPELTSALVVVQCIYIYASGGGFFSEVTHSFYSQGIAPITLQCGNTVLSKLRADCMNINV